MIVFYVLVVSLLCIAFWSQRKFLFLSWRIPNAGGIPFIGLPFKVRKVDKILPFLGSIFQKHGNFVFVWMGPFPIVLVNDASIAETVMTSKQCLDKLIFYKPIKYLGNGLFNLSGAKWEMRRKQINPSFHYKILSNFLPIFNRGADLIVENLEKLIGKESSDFSNLIENATLNVAAGKANSTP